jgi:hypothetical protein
LNSAIVQESDQCAWSRNCNDSKVASTISQTHCMLDSVHYRDRAKKTSFICVEFVERIYSDIQRQADRTNKPLADCHASHEEPVLFIVLPRKERSLVPWGSYQWDFRDWGPNWPQIWNDKQRTFRERWNSQSHSSWPVRVRAKCGSWLKIAMTRWHFPFLWDRSYD